MSEDVTALLSGIKERAEAVTEAVAQLTDYAIETDVAHVPEGVARPAILARLASSFDVPALVAAVEAALKTADDWKRFAASGDAQDECADELRAAITAALLRKEGTP